MDVIERLSLWGSTFIIYIALYFVIQSTTSKVKVSYASEKYFGS